MAKTRFQQRGRNEITVTTGSDFTWPDKLHGRKITFKVQPIRNGISITRGGRRGGIRAEGKARAGMVVCTSQGAASKCIRGKDLVVFPGGGAKVSAWAKMSGRAKSEMLLNGYSKTNRKARRTRRASKRS